MTDSIEFEYRTYKVVARRFLGAWSISIIPRGDGKSFPKIIAASELSDVIDEVKKVVDAAHGL
jgi:hypothetical protein